MSRIGISSPGNTLVRLLLARIAFATFGLIALLRPASSFAQTKATTEYQVKAAYIAGFTKFVVWPDAGQSARPAANSDDPFVIGVVGDDPFGPALSEAFAGATVNGNKVAIEHFRWDQDMRKCQAIFIPPPEHKHLHAILVKLKDSSVLTISDIPSFSSEGGMIGLVFDVDRIRFEINLDAANGAHLQISSKLLTLARSVKGHPLVHNAD